MDWFSGVMNTVDWAEMIGWGLALLALMGGAIKWLVGRQNQQADTLQKTILSLQQAEQVITDVQAKLKDARLRIEELEKITVDRADKVAGLEAENKKLKVEVGQLKEENKALRCKLEAAIKRIAELEKANNG